MNLDDFLNKKIDSNREANIEKINKYVNFVISNENYKNCHLEGILSHLSKIPDDVIQKCAECVSEETATDPKDLSGTVFIKFTNALSKYMSSTVREDNISNNEFYSEEEAQYILDENEKFNQFIIQEVEKIKGQTYNKQKLQEILKDEALSIKLIEELNDAERNGSIDLPSLDDDDENECDEDCDDCECCESDEDCDCCSDSCESEETESEEQSKPEKEYLKIPNVKFIMKDSYFSIISTKITVQDLAKQLNVEENNLYSKYSDGVELTLLKDIFPQGFTTLTKFEVNYESDENKYILCSTLPSNESNDLLFSFVLYKDENCNLSCFIPKNGNFVYSEGSEFRAYKLEDFFEMTDSVDKKTVMMNIVGYSDYDETYVKKSCDDIFCLKHKPIVSMKSLGTFEKIGAAASVEKFIIAGKIKIDMSDINNEYFLDDFNLKLSDDGYLLLGIDCTDCRLTPDIVASLKENIVDKIDFNSDAINNIEVYGDSKTNIAYIKLNRRWRF